MMMMVAVIEELINRNNISLIDSGDDDDVDGFDRFPR